MQRMDRRKALGLLSFLWLAALTIAYYVTHKPFTPEIALSVALTVWRFSLALILTMIAGGLGRWLTPNLSIYPLTRLSLQAALGLGSLSLLWLALGAAGGLRPLVGWGITLLLLVAFGRSALGWLQDWGKLTDAWSGASRLDKFLAGCLAFILLFSFVEALAPPVRFDALVYHLALPQRYLSQGRFVYIPEIMFWGMPQTGEMIYTWGMLLGGVHVATLAGWLFGVIAVIGIWGVAYESLGRHAAWVSVTALVSGSSLATSLSWGYVDWFVILFGTAWLVAWMLWIEQRMLLHLGLAGVLAGMAFGTKYTAGILLLIGLALILFQRRGSWRSTLGDCAIYGLGFVAPALPWLLKNFIATGNPIYPLLFPSGAMTPLRLALYQGGEPFGGWQDVLLLPWRATFLGIEGAVGYNSSIGPLLFGLGLCAWLASDRLDEKGRVRLKLFAWTAILGVLTWMIAGRFTAYLLQTRLYFVIFPALSLLAGAGFFGLKSLVLPGIRLGRLAAAFIVLVIGLNVVEIGAGVLRSGAAFVAFGLLPAHQYLEDNLGWYAPAMRALRALPAGSRALMLWETRSYDCWPQCEPDETLDRWLNDRYAGAVGATPRSNEEILAAWRRVGYTHLLVHRAGVDFVRRTKQPGYTPEDWIAFDHLLNTLQEQKNFGGAYSLYQLPP
jgi:hypothetical protein